MPPALPVSPLGRCAGEVDVVMGDGGGVMCDGDKARGDGGRWRWKVFRGGGKNTPVVEQTRKIFSEIKSERVGRGIPNCRRLSRDTPESPIYSRLQP